MNKISESLLNGQKNAKVSSMVQAMRGWETDLADVSSKPDGQFGRVVNIRTDNGLTISDKLDVEFEIPFDDDTEPNEATITVYNLSQTSIGYLIVNEKLTVTAGYGKDTGVIFSGAISSVKTKWEGQDKITTITAIDDVQMNNRDVGTISFKERVKASYILRTLIGELKLPLACFKLKKDILYSKPITVTGGLMSAIKQYAAVCGSSVYINKQKVYVQHYTEGDNLGFEVNVNTGLIDTPEEFYEEVNNEDYTDTIYGVTFKMLLEHRITTASIITMKSRNYNGKFRVRKGKHVCNESDFYTEVTAIR